MGRRPLLCATLALLLIAIQVPSYGHDIPPSVTVHAFVKPEGEHLRVLLRVPLQAMRDIQFPERDGFLDLGQIEPDLYDAVGMWILSELRVYEDSRELSRPAVEGVRVSLPSDRSFESYAQAIAHVHGSAIPPLTRLPRDQALMDVLLTYDSDAADASFAIRPGFSRLGIDVTTVLRFVGPSGVRPFHLRGDPGVVRLDPRWHQAARHFVELGFVHILDGIDHLLFLACLVVPLRRLRPLVFVVSSFTAAHSVTLIASALDLAPDALWFPPLVEMLIAASIVYMAIENVVARPSTPRRCVLAFGFGLVHGFGFSFALEETLQFAGAHLLTSLFSFNVGVELGQLAAVAAMVPLVHVFFRFVVNERMGTLVASVLVAHTAWHWMTERWNALAEFQPPALDSTTLLVTVRLLLVLFVVGAAAWFVRGRRWPGGAIFDATAGSLLAKGDDRIYMSGPPGRKPRGEESGEAEHDGRGAEAERVGG